jgi:hypothetical protein
VTPHAITITLLIRGYIFVKDRRSKDEEREGFQNSEEIKTELLTLGFIQVGFDKQYSALVFNFSKIFSISSGTGRRNSIHNLHKALTLYAI